MWQPNEPIQSVEVVERRSIADVVNTGNFKCGTQLSILGVLALIIIYCASYGYLGAQLLADKTEPIEDYSDPDNTKCSKERAWVKYSEDLPGFFSTGKSLVDPHNETDQEDWLFYCSTVNDFIGVASRKKGICYALESDYNITEVPLQTTTVLTYSFSNYTFVNALQRWYSCGSVINIARNYRIPRSLLTLTSWILARCRRKCSSCPQYHMYPAMCIPDIKKCIIISGPKSAHLVKLYMCELLCSDHFSNIPCYLN